MPNIVNLCNLPPWVIASHEFNEDPRPLELSGVRIANRSFFDKIRGVDDPVRRGEMFDEYITVKFQLDEWQSHQADARRSLRNSFVRYLRGWGVDSNSIEGAVLKAWVESRLGIPPTFHHKKMDPKDRDAMYQFALDRMKGSQRTNAINSQLDLLYEFCQEELRRRNLDSQWLTLYRGTFDGDDYRLIEEGEKRRRCVEMNNISSFTSDRECAWEFGSTVWEVRVPTVKIFFCSDLLPNSLLKGEDEYLVIGGEYWVKELLC